MDLSPTPVPSDEIEITDRIESLRNLVISLLVLVLIISGTFNLYLWYRFKQAGKDLEAFRPTANQLLADNARGSGPLMDRFVNQVTEYGKTHPDFGPIMTKYGLKTGPTGAVPSTPMPQVPSIPKK
jgi:hypothetical protein